MSEWREAKPPKREAGPIYNFRRGYDLEAAKMHENAEQYACFQKYLMIQGARSLNELERLTDHSSNTLSNWSKTFEWEKRAVEYDKKQMAIVWRQAEKLHRNKHKEAIVQFRESSERQAKMMSKVSEDLIRLLGDRILRAEEQNEEVPMNLVSGLLRAAASITEQSRQSWANALGINQMMEMVEAEMQNLTVEDVTDVDAYEIPIDE